MADILIRGIEMPKDGCRDCIFVNRKWRGDVCPILKREVTGNVERGGFQTDCPILPLPEVHGRLIDADALRPAFAKATWEFRDGYTFEWLLAHAPTIVPAEGGGDNGD